MDYEIYGCLAQHSWWSHLWQLLSLYNVLLTLRQDCYYPLPRKHDVGLMNLLVDNEVFTRSELFLLRINRVRHFKGVFAPSSHTVMGLRYERRCSRHLGWITVKALIVIQYKNLLLRISNCSVLRYTQSSSPQTLSLDHLGDMFDNLRFNICGNTLHRLMSSSGFTQRLRRL